MRRPSRPPQRWGRVLTAPAPVCLRGSLLSRARPGGGETPPRPRKAPAPVCLRGSSLARPGREGVRLPHIPCSRLPAGLGCGHPPLGLSPLLGPSLTSRSIADFPVGFPINWPLSGGLGSLASSPLWGQVLNDHPRHTEKAAGDFPGVHVVKHPPCKVGDAGPILSQVIKTPHAAE